MRIVFDIPTEKS